MTPGVGEPPGRGSGVAWGVVLFVGAWLDFGAYSGPLEGVLDLGNQGAGEGGMEGGGRIDTGILWDTAHLFPTPRNLGRA